MNCCSTATPLPCVLIFSQISERDGAALLATLANKLNVRKIRVTCVIITTYEERINGVEHIGKLDFGILPQATSDIYLDRCFRSPNPLLLEGMKDDCFQAWHNVFPETPSFFEPTIEGAINAARTYSEADGGHVLVTGSLYLVRGGSSNS